MSLPPILGSLEQVPEHFHRYSCFRSDISHRLLWMYLEEALRHNPELNRRDVIVEIESYPETNEVQI